MVNKMLTVPTNAITAEQARKTSYEEIESTLTKVFDEISQMSKSEWGVVNNRVSFTIPGKYYNNDEIIDEIVELFKQLGYVVHSYVNANKESVIIISWDFRRGMGE